MSARTRIALFVALLVVVAGVAAVAGGLFGGGHHTSPKADGQAAVTDAERGSGMDMSNHSGGHHEPPVTSATLPGLSSSEDGYELKLAESELAGPSETNLKFQVLTADGKPNLKFDVAHTKRLHLVVVRRDLTEFQHLHPKMGSDGTWGVPARFRKAGSYRVFADFTIDGKQRTLGADFEVSGAYEGIRLPRVSDRSTDDFGLTVKRKEDPDGVVSFEVFKDGKLINEQLQSYLGAKGHLVTLRERDLAYVHTHPEGKSLSFMVHLPSAGKYRSWVQFQLDGKVHTAAFTETQPK